LTDVLIGAFEGTKEEGVREHFAGLIDEVSIYNRALTASEIQAIFTAGSAGKCVDEVDFEVQIDINPGKSRNKIKIETQEVIPVVILSTETFDATTIDPITIRFGPSGTEAALLRSALKDVDNDGDTDMVVRFKSRDMALRCGDTSVFLTGETINGQAFQASDAILTVGCKR
jgi:hypothetical protein